MTAYYPARVLTGVDAEMFLLDKNNRIIPASTVVKDDKESGADIHYDNALLEIRTPGPRTCLAHVLDLLQGSIRKSKLEKVHRFCLRSAVRISPKKLKAHPECMDFGCNPSDIVLADGSIQKDREVNPDTNVRSAGFHIHQTIKSPEATTISQTVQLMDLLLGLPGVLIERDADRVRARRLELGYGVAGEHRVRIESNASLYYYADCGCKHCKKSAKPVHVLEYRTLGPWPMRHPIWCHWAITMARDVKTLQQNHFESISKVVERDAVIHAINHADVNLALELWNLLRPRLLDVGSYELSSAITPKNIAALEWLIAEPGVAAFDYVSRRGPDSRDDSKPISFYRRWTEFGSHEFGFESFMVRLLPNPKRYKKINVPGLRKFHDGFKKDGDNISWWRGHKNNKGLANALHSVPR